MPDTTQIETTKFAKVQWEVDDLMGHAVERGVIISEEDADRLLAENTGMIVDAMLDAGWVALDAIIDEHDE